MGKKDEGDRRSESIFKEIGDSSIPAPDPLARYSETRGSYGTPEVTEDGERLGIRDRPALAGVAAHIMGTGSPRTPVRTRS